MSAPVVPPEIFRQYDIRGVVDRDLSEAAVELIGRAYATRIENIFFRETIKNHTQATIPYGIIGVKVTKLTGDGQDFLHTGWSGDLSIGPGCTGPTDSCGGPWDDSLTVDVPGTYRLTLDIRSSPVDVATSGQGKWEALTPGIEIKVVNWTPPG